MNKLLLAVLLYIPCNAYAAKSVMEGMWTSNNSLYVATSSPSGYLVVGGSVTVNSNIGFSTPVTGIHWQDGSITTSAASGIGGSGPTGPTGATGAPGTNGVSNFTASVVGSYILISTDSTSYAVMTQNTDGTVSLSTSAATISTYQIISNQNNLAWVSADSSSGSSPALWQKNTPTAPFTIGTMAMYDSSGASWSFTVDSDGVFRTTRLGGF